MKLTLEDIKILTEGQQIKNAILGKYDSLEDFAEEVMLYPDSLKRYLRSKKCGSATFRIKLTQAMGIGYYQIALSPEEQIRKYVIDITENINEYNNEQCLEVLEALKNMCIKESMMTESAMMFRNIGMYYFLANLYDSAIEFYKLAIMTIEGRHASSLTVQYLSEIGQVYYYNLEYERAKRSYEGAEMLLEEIIDIKESILYSFYYRYGILYNTIGKCDKARNMYQRALGFTGDSLQKGDATMNIGISYKKQGLYKNAMHYYKMALHYYDDNKVKKSIVYNNMAETYKCMQQFEEALTSINKAFEYLERNSFEKFFVYHQTYAQIVEQMGQYEKALDKLFEILEHVKDGFVHRKFIINGINNMIKIVKKYNNETALRDIEKVLIILIKSTNPQNVEFIRELKSCIGDIYIYFRGLDS